MEDMRGYYLLGYYSTNAKADGTFRSIKVSVKRPGVASAPGAATWRLPRRS